MLAITVDGANGVYDIFAGELVCVCEFGLSYVTAVELFAFEHKLCAVSRMNGGIYTTAPRKALIRGIDDGVNLHFRDIVSNDL